MFYIIFHNGCAHGPQTIVNSTFVFNMKRSLSQEPTLCEANKRQRLFTADEVLDDLDNSDNVQNKGRIHDSLQSMGMHLCKSKQS